MVWNYGGLEWNPRGSVLWMEECVMHKMGVWGPLVLVLDQ